MKKMAVYTLCTTGITLLVLAAFATLFGAKFIVVRSVFESFSANVVIQAGLLLTCKFESSYAVLEYTLDIGYTIAVVLLFGAAFGWYGSTPVWVLILMAVGIYLAGALLRAVSIRQDIREINELLHQRNQNPVLRG